MQYLEHYVCSGIELVRHDHRRQQECQEVKVEALFRCFPRQKFFIKFQFSTSVKKLKIEFRYNIYRVRSIFIGCVLFFSWLHLFYMLCDEPWVRVRACIKNDVSPMVGWKTQHFYIRN